jgi:hypothetical protein
MPKPLRICCLECDVFKDFPPAVSTKQYYGEIVQDWLRVEAGEKWGQFHCNGESRVWQFCCLFCNYYGFSGEATASCGRRLGRGHHSRLEVQRG